MISSNTSFNNDQNSFGHATYHNNQQQDSSQIIDDRKSGQPNFQQSIIRDNDSIIEDASIDKQTNSSQLMRDNSVGGGALDGSLAVKANENYSPTTTQKNNLLSIKNESYKGPPGAIGLPTLKT